MAQLIRNILSSYLVRTVSILVDFFMLPFLSAQLGMEELGAFFLVRNAVVLFLQGDIGMGASTIRYVAVAHASDARESLNDVANTSFGFFLVLGSIITPLYVWAMTQFWTKLADVPLTSDTESIIYISAIGTVFSGMIWMYLKNLLIGIQRYDVANALQIAQSLMRTVGTVGFVIWGKGMVGAMSAEALSVVAAVAAAWLCIKRVIPSLKLNPFKVKPSLFREMLPYSAQMSLMGVFAYAIIQSGPLLTGALVSVAMVAVYTAALRIFQALKEMTSSLVQPLLPLAAQLGTEGRDDRLRLLLVKGTQLSNAISLSVVIPVSIFMDDLVRLWVGDGFGGAVGIAVILLAGLVLNNNHLVAFSLLQGVGRVRVIMALHAIWAISTIVFGILLAQVWEGYGIALGMVLPLLILEPLYIRAALKEFRVSGEDFYRNCIGIPLVGAVALGVPGFTWYEGTSHIDFIPLVTLSGGMMVSYLVLTFFLATNRSERDQITQFAISAVARSVRI